MPCCSPWSPTANRGFQGYVAIQGSKIAAVDRLRSEKPADGHRDMECRGQSVMPGLVNCMLTRP